jgi:hypothetical protein
MSTIKVHMAKISKSKRTRVTDTTVTNVTQTSAWKKMNDRNTLVVVALLDLDLKNTVITAEEAMEVP